MKWVSVDELKQLMNDLDRTFCLTHAASSFTPWFKLIVNEFLFPWWKELLEHPTSEGKYDAKVLASLENDKIHRL